MERAKSILGKKGKGRAQAAPPGELIALGKATTQEKSDVKRCASPQPATHKLLAAGSKRDATVLGGTSLLAKKPKVGSQTFTPLGRAAMESERRGSPLPSFSHAQPQLMAFEEAAIDVDPTELVIKVEEASKEGDEERVEKLLCGAVRNLRNNRSNPDKVVYLSVMYLVKEYPSFFLSELAIEAFCSVLKRDIAHNFKSKGNPLVSVLACNVMLYAFSTEENWPDNFVKVYIDDLLGERVWVDRADCRGFVNNILTAFNTKPTPRNLLVNIDGGNAPPILPGGASPLRTLADEDDASKSSEENASEKSADDTAPGSDVPVVPRYPNQMTYIQTYVTDLIKEHLAKRQSMDASCRNIIRLLTATAGYAEIRFIAGQRLEMWLQNPKSTRAAQDLLMAMCLNCNQENKLDVEIIQQLLKIRVKPKPLVTHYVSCIRELLGQHPDNTPLVVKTVLMNELTQSRNPNNMALLSVIFNHSPDVSSTVLAEVFQDLLVSKDDYSRALRGLLREVVRNTRQDINFALFSQSLTLQRKDSKFNDLEAPLKERYVLSTIDIICLSMFLSITPSVKEAISRADLKEREPLYKFRNQLAVIERDAIYWMHTMVPDMIELKPAQFVHCVRKLLFMESPEHYSKDNWPSENERHMMLRLVIEAPVLEDTLMRVLLMGLTRELPLTPNDSMDITDQLVRRAALLAFDNMEVLQMCSVDMFNAMLNLSTYHYPDNIILPKGYTPPTLAITGTYWKAWLVLLTLSAFNPTTFGKEAWEKYPILKCLMEMFMTNNYTFPPPTYAADEKTVEDLRSAVRQVTDQETQKILEFESHLAGDTITQRNSHLITQLTSLDPHGIARCPPEETMKILPQYNKTYKIGQMLCRSRNPDFLLDVIQRQGTSKSMPWLAELVEASEGSLEVLPVQCLCEFLLHDPRNTVLPDHGDDENNRIERHHHKLKIHKHQQLLRQLQDLVQSSPDNTTTMFDVLTYFLQRLASNQVASRQQAIKGLSMVITQPGSNEEEAMEVDGESSLSASGTSSYDWLLKYMPSLPMFPHVNAQLCAALRQAIQVETDPLLIKSYIIFLSQHAMDQNLSVLDDLALDVSQLIVERNSLMNHIMPDVVSQRGEDYDQLLEAFLRLFFTYLSKARRQEKGEYSWSNTQDQIILQWKTGESATMHILVVHAMVIILCYGLPKNPSAQDRYRSMLEIWFPSDDVMPKAFLLDTSEEALLLPDWLKLRMIRSSEPRLVAAALSELDRRQMLLFVQSFGIPEKIVSKLLQYLDAATESDPAGLMQIVRGMNDPAYISRLILIQRSRGVEGGDRFYALVTEGDSMPGNEKEQKMEIDKQPVQTLQLPTQPKADTSVNDSSLVSDFFKMFSPEIKPLEATKLFQKLLKVVAQDGTLATSLVQAIIQRVESSDGKDFIYHLVKHSARSSPFIKILLTKHKHVHNSLAPVLQMIMDSTGTAMGSSLSAIIREFQKTQAKQKPLSRRRQASVDLDSLKSEGKVRPDTFIEGIEGISDKSRLEPLVTQFMQESLQQPTSREAISTACNMLQKSTAAAEGSVESLLTDWLEVLDPEIVNASDDQQENLVFGNKAGKGNQGGKKKSNTYLLALLTHQSQWSTIQNCLARILQPQKLTQLNPTSVLDFVLACRHSPKIWQGRELKTVQDNVMEEVFEFTTEQVLAVVDFIVLEAAQASDDSEKHTPGIENTTSRSHQSLLTASTTTETKAGKATKHEESVNSRFDLLLTCICDRDDRIHSIVSHVQNRAPLVSRKEEQCYKDLLWEMYLYFPYIFSWLPPGLTTDWMVSDKIHAKLDTITHRLISVLGRAGPGKFADRMYDANMACRKLAAQHPKLFLRQLPLLAAVLGGRTQMSIGELRHTNVLLLFVHVMGLLELLQPDVFHRQHSALASILQAYFSLFRVHGKERKFLGSVLYKMVLFLQNFVTFDPQRASSMLQQYVQLLSDLSKEYDMPELKSLLTGLTLPRQNQSDSGDCVGVSELPEPAAFSVRAQGGAFFAQIQTVLRNMQEGSSDGLQTALHEVDEVSKRRVGILEHFEGELKKLMMHINERVRSTAFSLFMRYIHHSPRKAKDFIPSFLKCVQHSNPDVVTSALKNLPEFTVLCQEEASRILQTVFDAGVSSSMNMSSYINETMHLLSMESILYTKPVGSIE